MKGWGLVGGISGWCMVHGLLKWYGEFMGGVWFA